MEIPLTAEQWIAFQLSPVQQILLCIGLPMALTLMGHLIVRRLIRPHYLKQHNDITGPLFCVLGTIYGIFLTLIVTNTWHGYDDTCTNIVQEARCLKSLHNYATAFPEPFKGEIQSLLLQYREGLVSKEWAALARGKESPEVTSILNTLIKTYANHRDSGVTEGPFFAQSVRMLEQLEGLRASRIDDSQSGLLPFLWVILIAGAVLTTCFCFLFGAENLATHAIMTLMLTAVISMAFFTIITLDYPFTGLARISPDNFTSLKL